MSSENAGAGALFSHKDAPLETDSTAASTEPDKHPVFSRADDNSQTNYDN